MRDENQDFSSVVRINLLGVYDKVVSKLIIKLVKRKFWVPQNLCKSLRGLGM